MPKLSLTFDNGPSPGITDRVLNTLDEYAVPATFFVVGNRLESPEGLELTRRAFEAGYQIGNHSYSHGTPLGLQECSGLATEEITKTFKLLDGLAGPAPLYRPNGRGKLGQHMLNREAVECLIEMDASVVLWNCVPRDRSILVDRPDFWLSDAKEAIERNDWTLMVLHDRPSGFEEPGPMDFLPDFLDWAVAQGVEFRSDFPEECTPILRGQARQELEKYAIL